MMFLLMSFRQLLTCTIWRGIVEQNATTRALREIPGFLITVLSFESVVYIRLMSLEVGRFCSHLEVLSDESSACLCGR
jgi:hypothetical protein